MYGVVLEPPYWSPIRAYAAGSFCNNMYKVSLPAMQKLTGLQSVPGTLAMPSVFVLSHVFKPEGDACL